MNKELQKELNDLKDKLSDIEKRINQPQFEKGKWYRHTSFQNKFLLHSGIGYVNNGVEEGRWVTGHQMSDIKCWMPATALEIEEVLKAAAGRKGFKDGASAKCLYDNQVYKLKGFYNYVDDSLFFETTNPSVNCSVYEKGQWADIITEPVIKIGEYEVKFNGKESITVGCQTISKETIQTILDKLK